MATIRRSILGHTTVPDSTGKCYWAPIESQDTHATRASSQLCIVIEAPATLGDVGFFGSFKVPKDYVDTERIIITGTYGATPVSANTAFSMIAVAIADAEDIDTAYGAEASFTRTDWTGYADQDMLEMSFTPTVTLAIDDTVFYKFYAEDDADTQTAAFLLTDLEFEYSDTA